MFFFARNEEINQWLGENPKVVGAVALAIGTVMLGLGINALRTGQATTKRGEQLEGGEAKAMGFIWTGFGAACIAFAIYKLVV